MTPRPREQPGSAKEWLAHAQSDLALAKLAVGNQNVLSSQICFHAQQAAEKALKSALRFWGVEFPFTHDIDVLLDVIRATKKDVPSDINNAGELTPFAVETRYPGYTRSLEAEIQPALALAQAVVDWATKTVGE